MERAALVARSFLGNYGPGGSNAQDSNDRFRLIPQQREPEDCAAERHLRCIGALCKGPRAQRSRDTDRWRDDGDQGRQAAGRPYEAAPSWWPDWRGEGSTCVIVASGPSASEIDLRLAQGCARFIAINESYKLAPWADVLYACDWRWWEAHAGAPDFKGLKITQDIKATSNREWGVRAITSERGHDRLMVSRFGVVGWGGNSGFHCLQLAIQFGVQKVILVGFDMRLDKGLHWHGPHEGKLNNPTLKNVLRWRRVVDGVAPTCKLLGIEVINCSPVSELVNYPKMSFEKALGHGTEARNAA